MALLDGFEAFNFLPATVMLAFLGRPREALNVLPLFIADISFLASPDTSVALLMLLGRPRFAGPASFCSYFDAAVAVLGRRPLPVLAVLVVVVFVFFFILVRLLTLSLPMLRVASIWLATLLPLGTLSLVALGFISPAICLLGRPDCVVALVELRVPPRMTGISPSRARLAFLSEASEGSGTAEEAAAAAAITPAAAGGRPRLPGAISQILLCRVQVVMKSNGGINT